MAIMSANSKNPDPLINELRKYKLDDLLYLIADLSRQLFLDKEHIKEIISGKYIGPGIQQRTQTIPAFALAELSYRAMKYSNDYRNTCPKKDDLLKLINLLAKTEDGVARDKVDSLSPEEIKAHVLLGMTQRQIWYQEILDDNYIRYSFLRYYMLLVQVPATYFPDRPQPDQVFTSITGYSIQRFFHLMFLTCTHVLKNSGEINIKEISNMLPATTGKDFSKCLDFFTGDYKYYRQPTHPANPLFFKPIVRTDTNRLIAPDVFLFARKLYEGVYWILRDHYKTLNSQKFIDAFGEYYEKYIEQVVEFYLRPHHFRKIKETPNKKRADWLIFTGNYVLLIEQKSSLMTIALKQDYPSLNKLDKYLLNALKEGCVQISETIRGGIEEAEGKKLIKLLLHFENFSWAESVIKERLTELSKDEIDDLTDYFFIDTEEFERLMQSLADDERCFNQIIEEKIKREKTAPLDAGREFRWIIQEYHREDNIRYLDQILHNLSK